MKMATELMQLAGRAHSTPDPDTPTPTPDTPPPDVTPDDVPLPAHAPVREPSFPTPPIKAGYAA